jgi:4-hydroxybenzoate polyprenyltransferase
MRSAAALWRSCHPGPTVVVSTLSLLLGLAAGVAPGALALLVGAVFAGQLSIGWSNDAIDAGRDRTVGRTDKPIARGEIGVRTVWVATVAAVAAALVLSALLGPGFLVAHAVFLVSAWSYNVVLKRSVLSLAPFVLSFGIFPSLATLAADPARLAPVWAWVAGAALGAAVHLTNVLPDLDDDARTGVRGLPHRIGARASAVTAFAAVALGALAVLVGGWMLQLSPLATAISIAGCVLVLVVAAAGLVRALRVPDRTVFRLVMVSALLLALQLAATSAGL